MILQVPIESHETIKNRLNTWEPPPPKNTKATLDLPPQRWSCRLSPPTAEMRMHQPEVADVGRNSGSPVDIRSNKFPIFARWSHDFLKKHQAVLMFFFLHQQNLVIWLKVMFVTLFHLYHGK